MSVQNLRNKFSQNIEGGGPTSLTSPGTCFGFVANNNNNNNNDNNKFSKTKNNNNFNGCSIPKVNLFCAAATTNSLPKPSSFLINNSTASRQTTVVNSGSVTAFTNSPASSLLAKQNSFNVINDNDTSSSRQSSPTYNSTCSSSSSNSSINGNGSAGVRAVQNIANRWGSVTIKKPPEQCREDIIRNRWNKNVNNNNHQNNNNNNNNSNSNSNSNLFNSNNNTTVSEDSGYRSNYSKKYLSQAIISNNLNNESAAFNNHQYNNQNNSVNHSNNNNNNDSDKLFNINNNNNNNVDQVVVNGSYSNGSTTTDNAKKPLSRYTVHLNNIAVSPPTSINHSRNNSLDSTNNGFTSAYSNNNHNNNNNNDNSNDNSNNNNTNNNVIYNTTCVKGSNFNSSSNSSVRSENCFSGSEDDDSKYRSLEKAEATRNFQKVLKDYNDLQVKYDLLLREQNETKQILAEKSEQLLQLRTLSEAMCKEYDQLKTQFDLESTTMQKAMERATEWYKQNRELKRRSSLLMQHVMTVVPEKIPEMMDVADGYLPSEEQDTEINELRKTISDLNKEISRLKVDLNSVMVTNEQTNEQHSPQNSNALQDEQAARIKAERQYHELEMKYNQLCHTMRNFGDANSEVKGVELYQENSTDSELKEKLKLTQTELNLSLQKVKITEQQLRETTKKVAELERILNSTDSKSSVSIPQAPPLPTMANIPPPPPLPTLSSSNGTLKLKMQRHHHNGNADDSATDKISDLLGIQRKTAGLPPVEGDTIDKIINELKGGRFTLKSREKQNTIKKEEEEPPVVHEMRNILGTLKRQPARRRGSFKQNGNDDNNNTSYS